METSAAHTSSPNGTQDGTSYLTDDQTPVEPRSLPYWVQLDSAIIVGKLTIYSASPIYIVGDPPLSVKAE